MRSTFLMWPAARPRPAVQGRRTPAPAEGFMSPALAVLRMAAALEPDPLEAMAWYRSVPIAVLDGLTAAILVRQGRAYAVLAFLCAAIEIDRTERQTPR
ncbi:hypothetical protein I6J77_13225 [Rhodanobacter sp. FDAARGOS 1247]|uniref:hypothetical protein n=1 Tax=Rhodanobacter sp. FDAARGOS 1247 TaxID=2778082 RepID=UPI00194F75AD|nr:hypothetical protein [Rhodanobacter sp. FDAARGOS 1247]QRP63073.1 hypothetical protein I6J77_13225 [Rhodanobacter sp. FDAARGOS 1247]